MTVKLTTYPHHKMLTIECKGTARHVTLDGDRAIRFEYVNRKGRKIDVPAPDRIMRGELLRLQCKF